MAGETSFEPKFDRHSANQILPEVRERLRKLRDAYAELAGHQEHVRTLSPGNGADRRPGAGVEASQDFDEQLQWFNDAGIVVRDIEQGLVDFPSMREGRIVMLCWKAEEESVAYWHEPETGFGGRKPLD